MGELAESQVLDTVVTVVVKVWVSVGGKDYRLCAQTWAMQNNLPLPSDCDVAISIQPEVTIFGP